MITHTSMANKIIALLTVCKIEGRTTSDYATYCGGIETRLMRKRLNLLCDFNWIRKEKSSSGKGDRFYPTHEGKSTAKDIFEFVFSDANYTESDDDNFDDLESDDFGAEIMDEVEPIKSSLTTEAEIGTPKKAPVSNNSEKKQLTILEPKKVEPKLDDVIQQSKSLSKPCNTNSLPLGGDIEEEYLTGYSIVERSGRKFSHELQIDNDLVFTFLSIRSDDYPQINREKIKTKEIKISLSWVRNVQGRNAYRNVNKNSGITIYTKNGATKSKEIIYV